MTFKAENRCRASGEPTLHSMATSRAALGSVPRAACWGCGRYVRVNADGTFRVHSRFGRDVLG